LGASVSACGGPSKLASDPLIGGAPPLQANAPSTPTAKASGPVPPVPAPTSTASNAALASLPGRTVDGRHELQINEPKTTAPSDPGWTAPAGSSPPAPSQPLADANSSTNYTLGGGSKLGSFEQARSQLQVRNVTWWRLETTEPGTFKFSCSVPNRQNRQLSRTHEAQASSELAAIQAVLDQIDRER
jgi:hypothetical protein